MRSVVLFGLAYMAPMIVLGTCAAIAEETKGAAASAYLLALIAMLFTDYSYGRMARNYPVAGSAYTYVRRTIDSRVGFLIGWATLLDYFFLPMAIWLIGATSLRQGFPAVPLSVWVVTFMTLTTVLNVVGIRVADKVTLLLMTFQILVTIAFVGLARATWQPPAVGWEPGSAWGPSPIRRPPSPRSPAEPGSPPTRSWDSTRSPR